ncbi:MAG TPA: hypothetical protein VHP38_02245 [Ruminiclostridium sp.]|nr:hypothetical protein [Ruminiclostridium sp.]
MKKYIAGLLSGIIIAMSVTAFAAVELKVIPNPYPVMIDGTKADVQGYNINGSTYLKLSDLKVTGLNAKFANKQITISKAQESTETTKDGTTKMTSDSLKIYTIDDKEYVSMRDVCKLYSKFSYGIPEGLSPEDKALAFKKITSRDQFTTSYKDLIPRMEFFIYEGATYVSVDYYTNTILPLIKTES